ncbi:hypothetical protein ABE430_08895 [Brevibacillus agri]|uniref:hypothetical protein n=1 Tax=Brevibacillus agri TaxID=51101 RepID=UPI003D22649C
MTARKKDEPKEEAKALIYCGPALPNGILSRFAVYRGGIPKHLDEHLKKCPSLEQLFVPVDSLSSTLLAIETMGTAEHALYQEVQAYVKGGAR